MRPASSPAIRFSPSTGPLRASWFFRTCERAFAARRSAAGWRCFSSPTDRLAPRSLRCAIWYDGPAGTHRTKSRGMNGITHRPAFWIAFALISVLGGTFAWRYFPQALPLLNLEVKMSREEALKRAAAIADKLHLIGPDAREAALFSHDGATQNFVELEAGGKPAFAQLLSGEVYAPY